ncbi:hypothetical protein T265_15592, partial [Opisthorchis viverrini]
MATEEVQGLIVRGQNACNSGLDSAKWFGVSGDVTGTKETNSYTKYELELPLTETDCDKAAVLESGVSTFCEIVPSKLQLPSETIHEKSGPPDELTSATYNSRNESPASECVQVEPDKAVDFRIARPPHRIVPKWWLAKHYNSSAAGR